MYCTTRNFLDEGTGTLSLDMRLLLQLSCQCPLLQQKRQQRLAELTETSRNCGVDTLIRLVQTVCCDAGEART